ncbi:PEP/pyruvate-binding domain-containing protein [Euzebya sp.]|uniref:PEP/pyruvate-binding domain-containing protein n=1 Tax=Euzebya sp. TaxID=1971409 RepID=UPI003518EF59
MSEYVIWYDEYDETDRARVGGKNASLGTMMAAGLPVPPGFAVTTDAYDLLRTHADLVATVNGALAALDPDDNRRLQKVAAEIREAMETVPIDAAIEHDVRRAYLALCERCGVEDVPVAVRSSATAEDLPNASFAGQQDTYLWITGADAVVTHVRRCWSSIFTDRAIAYRRQMGFDDQLISMSVGVQKMVDPRAAGVAFTLNPSDGDRSQVAIDASWGLGESVVGGEVTPDNFLVDKVLRTIVSRRISSKAIEYRLDGDHVVKADVDADRRDQPCLTDDEVCAVAVMARRAERHYGCPQDIEWALDRHLPDGDNVILLQARPETVWSRSPRTPITTGGYDPMASIVSTLTAPVHARK